MPKLFDSHDHFQEWFSKDIEAHSQDQKHLNQIQLNRLHSILKPFMLRRVKKDVEKELGHKTEYHILCEMTKRQKDLYKLLKSKLCVEDIFHMLENKNKVKNLMNLVMQFRKVCNHPELFERSQVKSSFVLNENQTLTKNTQPQYGFLRTFWCNWLNPIQLEIPHIFYNEVLDSPRGAEIIQSTKYFKKNNKSFIWNNLFLHNESNVNKSIGSKTSNMFDWVT